jgi:hypothetical protein
MIENYLTESVWRRFRQHGDIVRGLSRAGFQWITDVAESPGSLPAATGLRGGAPNPFRVATTLSYELAAGGAVSLEVYGAQGRRVQTLDVGMRGPGTHSVVFNAPGLPSGVYYCRLMRDGQPEGQVTMLVKLR